jgi:hypothetical protein
MSVALFCISDRFMLLLASDISPQIISDRFYDNNHTSHLFPSAYFVMKHIKDYDKYKVAVKRIQLYKY